MLEPHWSLLAHEQVELAVHVGAVPVAALAELYVPQVDWVPVAEQNWLQTPFEPQKPGEQSSTLTKEELLQVPQTPVFTLQ